MFLAWPGHSLELTLILTTSSDPWPCQVTIPYNKQKLLWFIKFNASLRQDKASWKQKPGVKTNHWHLLQKFIAKEEFWFFKELLGQSQQDNSFHGEKGESSLHLRAQMKYWLGLDMIWICKFLSTLSLQICSIPVDLLTMCFFFCLKINWLSSWFNKTLLSGFD